MTQADISALTIPKALHTHFLSKNELIEAQCRQGNASHFPGRRKPWWLCRDRFPAEAQCGRILSDLRQISLIYIPQRVAFSFVWGCSALVFAKITRSPSTTLPKPKPIQLQLAKFCERITLLKPGIIIASMFLLKGCIIIQIQENRRSCTDCGY